MKIKDKVEKSKYQSPKKKIKRKLNNENTNSKLKESKKLQFSRAFSRQIHNKFKRENHI